MRKPFQDAFVFSFLGAFFVLFTYSVSMAKHGPVEIISSKTLICTVEDALRNVRGKTELTFNLSGLVSNPNLIQSIQVVFGESSPANTDSVWPLAESLAQAVAPKFKPSYSSGGLVGTDNERNLRFKSSPWGLIWTVSGYQDFKDLPSLESILALIETQPSSNVASIVYVKQNRQGIQARFGYTGKLVSKKINESLYYIGLELFFTSPLDGPTTEEQDPTPIKLNSSVLSLQGLCELAPAQQL